MSSKKYRVFSRAYSSSAHEGLYKEELTAIPRGGLPNERERDEIYVRSIDLTWYQTNRDGSQEIPVFCRWAFLKAKVARSSNTSLVTLEEVNKGLFMLENLQNDKDFSNTASAIQRAGLPFNPNKWDVLDEGVHHTSPRVPGTGITISAGDVPSFVNYDVSIPVKESITFSSDDSESCTAPIIFVWWTDRWGGLSTSGYTPGATSNMATGYRIVMTYEDVI